GISAIFSHQETGLKITYDRDKSVSTFCKKNKISWHQFQSNGVIRGLKNRENWQKRWYEYMQEPVQQPDFQKLIPFEISPEFYQSYKGETLSEAITLPNPDFQPGGETFAFKYLQSFTNQRVANYSRHISKPAHSRKSCSRLSPYIAWGCLSVRQVYQSQQEAEQALGFSRQFQAFASRLRWHCHFIQKFEMEDRIESENINRGYDSLIFEQNQAHFEAWKYGNTGFPLVDACMRCLQKTGYLNFRMRAMVVSFLTHQLFEHWKAGADFLATLFLDFEPGIHYPQFQMQAGITGTNTVRMYNPIKQSVDHDPEGKFIRLWILELAYVPDAFIHEPWLMNEAEQAANQCLIGKDYPAPIVDFAVSNKVAKEKLYAHKKEPTVKKEKERILQQHVIPGTNREWQKPRKPKSKIVKAKPPKTLAKKVISNQLELL
ncbi:MAG: deoxyribodipyrimidine photo-lyase/cryptochrome family protein, partial [Verrucomicrobia bacterium]|nr:deoxyribodipyrimidine photo-lyase/cryptochrome family protein [Cytophagales bacterium]